MDFSSLNKTQLLDLVEEFELEVDANRKNKPTIDELIATLEPYEKENPEYVEEVCRDMGLLSDNDEEDTEDDEDTEEDEIDDDLEEDNDADDEDDNDDEASLDDAEEETKKENPLQKELYPPENFKLDLAGTHRYVRNKLEEFKEQGLCLKGLVLRGVDLTGVDLRSTDLTGIDLRDCIVDKANFQGCNFTDAKLDGVDFSTADTRWIIGV